MILEIIKNYSFLKKSINFFNQLINIFQLVSIRLKIKAKLLIIVTLCCSIMEAGAVVIVVPMISLLMNPLQFNLDPRLLNALSLFGTIKQLELENTIITIFIFTVLIGGTLRIWLISLSAQLASSMSAELADIAFRKILSQKYEYLIRKNSSEYISVLTEKISMVSGLLLSLLSLFNSTLILIFIWFGLFLLDSKVTLIATLFFSTIYMGVIYLTRKKIDSNSTLLSVLAPTFIKNLRETFGSIRDIILSGAQPIYQNSFSSISRNLKYVGAENILMSQSPRYIVEMIGLSLIAILAKVFLQEGGMKSTLPLLAGLAIGVQRMLPLVQIIYAAYVNIRITQKSMDDVLSVMSVIEPKNEKFLTKSRLKLEREIEFNEVSLRYSPNSTWVIKNLNLKLNVGCKYAVIGVSGVGKSTFLDLLTGLLEPTRGYIYIDSVSLDQSNLKSWRESIAYVSQSVFLSDSTIAENIAFGIQIDEIDMDRVKLACEIVYLTEFIESRPEKYLSKIGEMGIFLSGGQRQRLGIARSIYKNPDILILDEATNSLDISTEHKVIMKLHSYNPKLTIIHVTHRLEITKDYQNIIEFSEGHIVRQGTYDEIFEKTPLFCGI